MATAPQFSDAYGSATLYGESGRRITALYQEDGHTAMPLGHNSNSRDFGVVFDIGSKGLNKGHALTFGRTRGGKGVSCIVPALLTYKGSMVVIDPKGENAWATAERRRQLGHRVVILDPWDEVNKRYGTKAGITEHISRFNPFSALDPADPDFADAVSAIADAFIYQTGSDPHWSDSARELVGGFIAAEVQRHPGKASVRRVRQLITSKLVDILKELERINGEFPDSVATSKLAASFEVNKDGIPFSEKELSSIRSTARTQTAFLDSARLQDSMETDEIPFDLASLGREKVTLYLVLPVDRLHTHGRWLRMILTLAIRAVSKLSAPPDPPVVFILDELGTISPGSGLPMIEQSYGLMAGMGIRIWAFLQDLPQLQRDYRESWETFISNSSVIQLLNVADNTTAEYFSKYMGNGTVNAKTGSRSQKTKEYGPGDSWDQRVLNRLAANFVSGGDEKDPQKAFERAKLVHFAGGKYRQEADGSRNYENGPRIAKTSWSLHESVMDSLIKAGFSQTGYTEWSEDEQLMSRPVMFPWEIMNADSDQSIILVPGMFNVQLPRFRYYSDPVLSPWARPNPNLPPPVIDPGPVAPPVQAAPPQQPPANTNVPPSANQNTPPSSLGDQLTDLGKDAAKKAAGAATDWLRGKMGGR